MLIFGKSEIDNEASLRQHILELFLVESCNPSHSVALTCTRHFWIIIASRWVHKWNVRSCTVAGLRCTVWRRCKNRGSRFDSWARKSPWICSVPTFVFIRHSIFIPASVVIRHVLALLLHLPHNCTNTECSMAARAFNCPSLSSSHWWCSRVVCRAALQRLLELTFVTGNTL